MIVTRHDAVLVQGITGRQGSYWTERMRECGTNVVAGVSPGKGGQEAGGLPVYDTGAEAARDHQLDVSVLFVPPLAAKQAALDALAGGIKKIVLLPEHVPYQDVIEVLAEAAERQAQVLGPNTAGLVVPGESSVGIMPGFASNIFCPGVVGVVSRSGSLGTLMCLNIVQAGLGQSAFIGVGGDPILGTTLLDAICILDDDPRTAAIVLVGEVGGAMEEEAAGKIATIDKPVIGFIAGRTAPPERRMGHAGAIVAGVQGSAESKVEALTAAGARVLAVPSELQQALGELAIDRT